MESYLNGSINVTSPAPRSVWKEILDADPNAMIYHEPAWTDMLCSTGDYADVSRLYEAVDGRKWVVPMVRSKAVTATLATQGSFPRGWGQGGIVSGSPLCSEMICAVFQDLSRQPVLQTLLQPSPLLSSVWEAGRPAGVQYDRRVTHVLSLEGGFDAVWKQFQSTTRTAIRKAEHSNLTVEWDSTGKLLPIFWDMFMSWAVRRGRERHLPAWLVRRSNALRDPIERFQLIAKTFGDACRVYVAWAGGEPVASSVFLIHRDHAFFYRGTSIREKANPVRANDLLQCMMIQEACQAGCHYYHMGESGGVESLMRFKTGFGAAPIPVMGYSIERLPMTHLAKSMEGLMKRVEHRLLSLSG